MKFTKFKEKFIETCGNVRRQWAVNKSNAQIQALLIAPDPLTMDNIIEVPEISKGNANMSIRELMDWKPVYKKSVSVDWKEDFVAEKDVWKWALKIGNVRKQCELNPVPDLFQEFASSKEMNKTPGEQEFSKQIKELNAFTQQVGKLGDKLFSSLRIDII